MDLPANIILAEEYRPAVFELIQEIIDHKCCAFVGAGLSKMAGYPLWEELLNILKLEAERKLGKKIEDSKVSKYQRGDNYKNILGIRKFREIINHEFDPDNDRQSFLSSHLSLVEMPFTAYITTNFDCNIEHAFIAKGQEPVYSFYPLLAITRIRERQIFHIHGVIDHDRLARTQGSIILTESDFGEAYKETSKVVELLKCLYTELVIVFLGFNVADEIFMRILKNSQADYEEIKRISFTRDGESVREVNHYAFLEYNHKFDVDENGIKKYLDEIDYESTTTEDQDMIQMGVKPIRYIGDKNNHKQLINILAEMSIRINGLKRIVPKQDNTFSGEE